MHVHVLIIPREERKGGCFLSIQSIITSIKYMVYKGSIGYYHFFYSSPDVFRVINQKQADVKHKQVYIKNCTHLKFIKNVYIEMSVFRRELRKDLQCWRWSNSVGSVDHLPCRNSAKINYT